MSAAPVRVQLPDHDAATQAAATALAPVCHVYPTWQVEEATTGLSGLLLAATVAGAAVDHVHAAIAAAADGWTDQIGTALQSLTGHPVAHGQLASWLLRMMHAGHGAAAIWRLMAQALEPWTTRTAPHAYVA